MAVAPRMIPLGGQSTAPQAPLFGPQPVQRDPRLEMAELMLREGSSTAPVQSHTEGLARMLTGGLGGLQRRQALDEEERQRKDRAGALADALLGGTSLAQVADATGQSGPTHANAEEMTMRQGRREELANALASGVFPESVAQEAYARKLFPDLYAKQQGPIAVSPGETLLDPATHRPIFQAPFKPNEPAEQPSDVREYLFALTPEGGGFKGSFVEYQLAQKKAGATNVTTKVGEGDKFYEELDKSNAKMFGELQSDGVQAARNVVQIDRLESLLAKSGSGAGANLSMIAGEFGIDTEGLSDIQAAQALINQMVPAQRPAGSGQMSDADLELFKASLPRIINQPGGNKIIIDTMRGIAQYTVAQGEIASRVANREIMPREGRALLKELPNPLANVDKLAPETASNAPKVGTVEGGFRFKGGDPASRDSWEPVE